MNTRKEPSGKLMFMPVAASIAELVSAYPTSGGLYSASAFLVPRAARPLTGYLIGWLNLLGQVSGVASTEFSISRFIWAAVVISKDGDYEVTNAKLWGLYAGLLVLHGAINCLPTGSRPASSSSTSARSWPSALLLGSRRKTSILPATYSATCSTSRAGARLASLFSWASCPCSGP
jgi:amino acid transporter